MSLRNVNPAKVATIKHINNLITCLVNIKDETGEFLLTNLMRAQLALGVRLGIVALLVLGALPLLFVVAPMLSDVLVLGIRLPWLLLGLAPYPFLLGLAHLYTRHAERNELDFADNVED